MDPLFFDCYSPKQLAPKKRKQKKRKVTKIKPAPPAPATINKINIVIRQDKHDEHRELKTVEKEPEVTVEEEPSVVVQEQPRPPPTITEPPAAKPAPIVLAQQPLFDKDEILKLLQEGLAATAEVEPEPAPSPPAAEPKTGGSLAWQTKTINSFNEGMEAALAQEQQPCLKGVDDEIKRDRIINELKQLRLDLSTEFGEFIEGRTTPPDPDELSTLEDALFKRMRAGCQKILAELK